MWIGLRTLCDCLPVSKYLDFVENFDFWGRLLDGTREDYLPTEFLRCRAVQKATEGDGERSNLRKGLAFLT